MIKFLDFRGATRVIFGFVLVTACAATARADVPVGGYTQQFWGPSAGARVCDATNVDGICIAWHSVLKGISPARLANCSPWGCDLRPDGRPLRAPAPDDSVARQLAVQQHEIAPAVLDANAKPTKPAHPKAHEVRVDGPAGTRDDHGPIVPKVIEVHSKD